MLELLQKYRKTIFDHEQSLNHQIAELKYRISNLFQQYLQQFINHHVAHIYKQKAHPLQKQLATIQYFISVLTKKNESEKDESKEEEINKVNLFSVFKKIDDIIENNRVLLEDVQINWVYPQSQSDIKYNHILYLKGQNQLFQEHLQSIYAIINSQNQDIPLRKLQKKIIAVSSKYSTLEKQLFPILYESKGLPIFNTSKIKLKDTITPVCIALNQYKYLDSLEVNIVSGKGIMLDEDYEKLFEIICSNNKLCLNELVIRIMDMEFCQSKCDIIRRKMKHLKYLEKFVIYNYYKQCKLGNFPDFVWKPFRAGVNIGCQVWK